VTIAGTLRPGGLCLLTAWAAIAVAQPAPPSTAAAAPTEGKCGLLLDTPDGKGMFQPRPELHPLSQTGPGKTFAIDAPAGAAVMCGRSSILPMPHDIQVVLTGRAFYIINKESDRIGVIEMDEGRCEYRMVKGALTADEEAQLQPRLDAMQKIADGGAA
jgi:hypothetical protein